MQQKEDSSSESSSSEEEVKPKNKKSKIRFIEVKANFERMVFEYNLLL